MNASHFSRITDELLSAYLDDDLTRQEREMIESAIEADANIAWRLESLRQTVQLLSNLPEIAPQRSFILTESMVGDVTRARRQAAARRRQATAQATAQPTSAQVTPATHAASRAGTGTGKAAGSGIPDSWSQRLAHGWRAFWHNGNPMLRNLAAVSLVLTILFTGADSAVRWPASPSQFAMQQEPLAAPAAAVEATTTESTTTESIITEAITANSATTERVAPEAVALTAPATEDTAPSSEITSAEISSAETTGATVAIETLGDEATEGAPVEPEIHLQSFPPPVDDGEEADMGGFGAAEAPGLLDGSESGRGSAGGMGGGDGVGVIAPRELAPPIPGMGFEPSRHLTETEANDTEANDLSLTSVPEDAEGDEAVIAATALAELTDESTDEATGELASDESAPDPAGEIAAFALPPVEEDQATDEQLAEQQAEQVARLPAPVGIVEPELPPADDAEVGASTTLLAPDTITADTVTIDAATDDAVAEDAVADLASDTQAEIKRGDDTPDASRLVTPELETPPAGGVLVTASPLANLLQWIQWAFLLGAVTFGMLWWRSRNRTRPHE